MITAIFSFAFALLFLSIAAGLLFLAKKNIRGRCGTPEGCKSCKKKCRREK